MTLVSTAEILTITGVNKVIRNKMKVLCDQSVSVNKGEIRNDVYSVLRVLKLEENENSSVLRSCWRLSFLIVISGDSIILNAYTSSPPDLSAYTRMCDSLTCIEASRKQ